MTTDDGHPTGPRDEEGQFLFDLPTPSQPEDVAGATLDDESALTFTPDAPPADAEADLAPESPPEEDATAFEFDPAAAETPAPDEPPAHEFIDLTDTPESGEFAAPVLPSAADRRRADIDAKQAVLAQHVAAMGCEGVILFTPAHVAWFTGGMNVRGLIAETERPGVFTNGRQRWLICGNVDAQRLFDEELDQLGFQLKEWQWAAGRAPLIGELLAGRKIACDRPFPGMPLIVDRLRADLRPLLASDRERLDDLGRTVAHAVEATARTLAVGDTEQEVAGQVAHRLLHHGADLVGVSVAADDRARRFRRSGFTATPVERACTIQATGTRDGLHVTVSRTVCFGPPDDRLRDEFAAATKVSAAYRAVGVAGKTLTDAAEAGRRVVHGSAHEHEWRRLSQPGYGTGWHAAEELRRMSQDERLVEGQAVVWQARVGAAVVSTVALDGAASTPVTPPDGWPFKRVRIGERAHDVPDILVRAG